MLTINIEKQLGQTHLCVNAQLPTSGVSAIFGRSGAGKTSLVNILGGLSTPDSGELLLGDKVLFRAGSINLPPEKRRIGYVFQEARLFPHYKVRGNLNYGMRHKNTALFERVVSLLGIGHLLDRFPITLSGGEKQRVAIGRALLTQPDMLLMDEPLASLDLPRKRELIPYLQSLSREMQLPIVYVSHSLDEILQLADYMLVLNQGKVIASGPLTQVWNSDEMRPWLPAKELSSLITAQVAGCHPDYAMTKLLLDDGNHLWVNGKLAETRPVSDNNQSSHTTAPATARQIKVRIQANHVALSTTPPGHSSIRNQLSGKVKELHPSDDGQQVQVKIALGNDELWANITPWACDELALIPGMQVYAQIKGVSMGHNDLAQSN
ncbi:molybdenum import ATP-binding protein ModC [Shewanella sp. NFH-SH190041]|uniref:molybdenum ABC transporter ATP-binding protein ModC n=1 Tax=Shewanella sp. NFH-SH190041 TaxID=2950245 RepID=UPI0021C4236C|nr:molybdenum ABC transporter ATP-binding protein ModC [Shewanella sp. NFH-SH190041]BDM62846.1 molybdenum import ATP-binding protein ModC [Shewanella sp. NFH-SH190041]